MVKKDKSTESVYKVTEVIGTSTKSWEDAAKNAVETASGTLRDLRIAEVVKMDVKIENGKVKSSNTARACNCPLSTKAESLRADEQVASNRALVPIQTPIRSN